MRYRLPDDCAGVSLAGVILDRLADGTIEAEESAAAALAPHGIAPADEPSGKAASARLKAETKAETKGEDRRMLR